MSLPWPGPHIEWHTTEGHTLNVLLWSQQTKFGLSYCTESIRILTAVVTDVIKWHWKPPAFKRQIQNKDHRRTGFQDTFTTANTKTGPHKTFDWAACGPWVGHGWSRLSSFKSSYEEQDCEKDAKNYLYFHANMLHKYLNKKKPTIHNRTFLVQMATGRRLHQISVVKPSALHPFSHYLLCLSDK